jgi:hypothetical protein
MVGASLKAGRNGSGLSPHAREGVMQMASTKVERIAPIPSIMKSA